MCDPETDLTDLKKVGRDKKKKLKVAFLIDLKIRKFELPIKNNFSPMDKWN
jgi:hypothetical protein